jgi:hypothetical protein
MCIMSLAYLNCVHLLNIRQLKVLGNKATWEMLLHKTLKFAIYACHRVLWY